MFSTLLCFSLHLSSVPCSTWCMPRFSFLCASANNLSKPLQCGSEHLSVAMNTFAALMFWRRLLPAPHALVRNQKPRKQESRAEKLQARRSFRGSNRKSPREDSTSYVHPIVSRTWHVFVRVPLSSVGLLERSDVGILLASTTTSCPR